MLQRAGAAARWHISAPPLQLDTAMTCDTLRSPLGRLSSGSSGCGGRASIFRSRLFTQGSAVTYSRACGAARGRVRLRVEGSLCLRVRPCLARQVRCQSQALPRRQHARVPGTHRLFEVVLDGAGGGGELQAEGHAARLTVNGQVLDEPAVHNVHAKVGVDDAGQRRQHLALLGHHRRGAVAGLPARGCTRGESEWQAEVAAGAQRRWRRRAGAAHRLGGRAARHPAGFGAAGSAAAMLGGRLGQPPAGWVGRHGRGAGPCTAAGASTQWCSLALRQARHDVLGRAGGRIGGEGAGAAWARSRSMVGS